LFTPRTPAIDGLVEPVAPTTPTDEIETPSAPAFELELPKTPMLELELPKTPIPPIV
jgi:hypothetical protein